MSSIDLRCGRLYTARFQGSENLHIFRVRSVVHKGWWCSSRRASRGASTARPVPSSGQGIEPRQWICTHPTSSAIFCPQISYTIISIQRGSPWIFSCYSSGRTARLPSPWFCWTEVVHLLDSVGNDREGIRLQVSATASNSVCIR